MIEAIFQRDFRGDPSTDRDDVQPRRDELRDLRVSQRV